MRSHGSYCRCTDCTLPSERSISRDLVCWYCRRGAHERCALPLTCACFSCYKGIPNEDPPSAETR
jgi:hypothetical protein